MPAPTVARIYRGTPHNLRRLAAALRRGELVAAPTETVYGLCADATNAKACREIFRAKRRPAADPLIVHIHHLSQLSEIADPGPEAFTLAKAFWPGPLTFVLPKRPAVPPVVTAGRDSVAVRMPAHPLFRRLLRLCGRPVAAPSANPFGYISPTTAEHVRAGLGRRIGHILDGGPCPIGLESTIIDLRRPNRPVILRPGAIGSNDLAAVLGRPVKLVRRRIAPSTAPAVAPGLLARHYSPRTPVELHRRLPRQTPADEARVHFQRPTEPMAPNDCFLAGDGRGQTAAPRLFALLRELDAGQWRRLHIELAPDTDPLAPAINDRLRRAEIKGLKG